MSERLIIVLTHDDGTLRAWEDIQRELLKIVFDYRGGNVWRLADEMGEHRSTMFRRLKKLRMRGRGRSSKRARGT